MVDGTRPGLDRAIISASKPSEGQRFWLYRDGHFARRLSRAGTCKALCVTDLALGILHRHRLAMSRYAELAVTTNFSFLRGASHPGDLVAQAAQLGYAAIGIADRNTLAGVVRAYEAWRQS